MKTNFFWRNIAAKAGLELFALWAYYPGMKKPYQEWPAEVRERFKGELNDLVDRSGYSISTFADIFGVGTSLVGIWLDVRDPRMPTVPAFELLSMACESEEFFREFVRRRERFTGRVFPQRKAAGRPKINRLAPALDHASRSLEAQMDRCLQA
jgi:hypothetical protein